LEAAQAERRRRRLLMLSLVAAILLTLAAIELLAQPVPLVGNEPTPPSALLPAFVVQPDRRELASSFERWGRAYDVPVALLEGLAWRESEWDNTARSPAGAIGIGQLLPPTADFVAREVLGDPSLDPTKPADNIRLTARYLRGLIDRFGGDERTAVAAYLQGSTSVADEGPTAQTRAYVRDVYALRDQFAAARAVAR
jgi:soluble lytic murein transglycosylase-like protein